MKVTQYGSHQNLRVLLAVIGHELSSLWNLVILVVKHNCVVICLKRLCGTVSFA